MGKFLVRWPDRASRGEGALELRTRALLDSESVRVLDSSVPFNAGKAGVGPVRVSAKRVVRNNSNKKDSWLPFLQFLLRDLGSVWR
jgi:hypothetical protein